MYVCHTVGFCAFIDWNRVIHGMWSIMLIVCFDSSVIAERGEKNWAPALHRWEDIVFDLNARTSNQMLVSWLLMCELVERCSQLGSQAMCSG